MVGVLRSVKGNLPNILERISSFKNALGSIVSNGLARGRRTNPAAVLRILSTYGTPVLMSGLGSLFLSDKEVSCVDQQYKRTLQNIVKLAVRSPPSLVHFIAGSLPATAILHLRQMTLFGMICRLPGDPLHLLLTSSSDLHQQPLHGFSKYEAFSCSTAYPILFTCSKTHHPKKLLRD